MVELQFYSKKEYNNVVKKMKAILEIEFDSQVKLFTKKTGYSETEPEKNRISINMYQPLEQVWQDFFHEMGHNRNYRDGKFNEYERTHTGNDAELFRALAVIKLGIKAELGADRSGKKLMKRYMPHLRWNRHESYSNPRVQKLYRQEFVEPEIEYLEEIGYFD
jgi:hypothetical protein